MTLIRRSYTEIIEYFTKLVLIDSHNSWCYLFSEYYRKFPNYLSSFYKNPDGSIDR